MRPNPGVRSRFWQRLRASVVRHRTAELEDDNLTILDLENILLTGRIVERQKDRGTRETKTVIRGRNLDDRDGEAVVKINLSGTLYVVTIYLV